MSATECTCSHCNGYKGDIWRATQEIRSLLNILQARPGSPGSEWRKSRLVEIKADLARWRAYMADHAEVTTDA